MSTERAPNIFSQMVNTIKNAETVARTFNIAPFPIYFIGGSGCILGGYTNRATMDVDFVDIGYSADLGRVFAMFMDYDMLEYESAVLSPKRLVRFLTSITAAHLLY